MRVLNSFFKVSRKQAANKHFPSSPNIQEQVKGDFRTVQRKSVTLPGNFLIPETILWGFKGFYLGGKVHMSLHSFQENQTG